MRESLIRHLRTVVQMRTVGTDREAKRQCLQWIRGTFLEGSPLLIEEGELHEAPYLYLSHPEAKILWFAHIDVVPGREDQFTLQIEGDTAFARGAKDMKGAALTLLLAYSEACKNRSVPPVSILLTSDEETGGKSLKELASKKMFDAIPVAYTPDTGGHPGIVTELKGAVWARLTMQGESGHGAWPWKSKNPVLQLAQVIRDLEKKFPQSSEAEWKMTVTPTELRGSDAINRIPATATCVLDIRHPSHMAKNSEEALTIVRQHLPKGSTLEKIVSADPMYTDPGHPMVQMLKGIAEQVEGRPVTIGREHGSSDARVFASHGIPAFLYGPEGGDLHGENEWVSIPSLEKQVEINTQWLAAL